MEIYYRKVVHLTLATCAYYAYHVLTSQYDHMYRHIISSLSSYSFQQSRGP